MKFTYLNWGLKRSLRCLTDLYPSPTGLSTHVMTSSQLTWELNWWSTAPASQRSGFEFRPGARFSEVPRLFGRISGDIILFVSSKRRRLGARNFAKFLNFYSLYNMWTDQLYRVSRSEFHEWLFGPEKFSGFLRKGPKAFHRRYLSSAKKDCENFKSQCKSNPFSAQLNITNTVYNGTCHMSKVSCHYDRTDDIGSFIGIIWGMNVFFKIWTPTSELAGLVLGNVQL